MEHYQNPDQQKRPKDELTVKGAFLKIKALNRFIAAKWKFLFAAAVIGGVAGLLYASLKKTFYTAECTFVLQEAGDASGGGLGRYSELASMVGVDVGGGGGLFQGDNIIELYKSRLMVEKTLLTSVSIAGKSQLLIERYLAMNHQRAAWAGTKLEKVAFGIPKQNFTLEQDSIISIIVSDINKNYLTVDKPDKKLSIISVKTKAKDELFAKAFTQTIVRNVNSFYVETKTKGILQNLQLLQRQSDSIRMSLNSSIGSVAAAVDANPNPNPALSALRVPSQRRQIDVQSNSVIYAEVVKNLEITRGILQRSTPLIQIIDEPILPLANDKVSRLKSLVNGAVIAVVITILSLISVRVYQKILE